MYTNNYWMKYLILYFDNNNDVNTLKNTLKMLLII